MHFLPLYYNTLYCNKKCDVTARNTWMNDARHATTRIISCVKYTETNTFTRAYLENVLVNACRTILLRPRISVIFVMQRLTSARVTSVSLRLRIFCTSQPKSTSQSQTALYSTEPRPPSKTNTRATRKSSATWWLITLNTNATRSTRWAKSRATNWTIRRKNDRKRSPTPTR